MEISGSDGTPFDWLLGADPNAVDSTGTPVLVYALLRRGAEVGQTFFILSLDFCFILFLHYRTLYVVVSGLAIL